MDDLGGLYGLRPQGKSAPMSASKPRSTADSWLNDDLFSNLARPSTKPADPILENLASMPVFDKPLYDEAADDDDMFVGVPGVRSSSAASSAPFDVFESLSMGSGKARSSNYDDDLLENLGRGMGAKEKRSDERRKQEGGDFDDLIPGFGGSGIPKRRESPDINQARFTASSAKPTADTAEDPFIVLESASTSGTSSSGQYTDTLEHMSRAMNSGSTKVDTSSASGGNFYEIDSFGGLQNSVHTFKNEINQNIREKNPSNDAQNINTGHQFSGKEPFHQFSPDVFDDILPKGQPYKSNSEKRPGSNDFNSSEMYGTNSMDDQSPKFNEHLETANDVWLTVSEIPLFTQLTSAPPPSRPPPPLVIKQTSFGANAKLNSYESFSQSTRSYYNAKDSMRKSAVSPIDELEDFAMGKPQNAHDRAGSFSNEEEFEANLAAAAMKEAMDRAEAKFKHAKEVREREAKSKDFMQQEHGEKTKVDDHDFEDRENQERLDREQEQKLREEREKEQKRLQRERELEQEQKQREEREKEQKRLQREREFEIERERARQAVERATREARERAAAEARQKAERAAVEKAGAEARQRAERAAVQRVAAEARERAAAEARARAAEAREKAEKAAREKASAEARERSEKEKSERAAAERVAAEARNRAERAVAEARERAAAAARERQQKPDDDLESFFGMGTRATSAPKTRSTTAESMFDGQTQNKGSSDGPRRTSSTSSSSIKKASSATNIVDDLSSIFGGPPSSGEFQEIEGETEERRRARLERHQRTLERAAKALADKNERDMQNQREQAERHRIGETLDFEIKRWAAGKEGNLRALLSTMQYVLWPECGWQPVSLTDLITAASVKKVYRKATLCIHPDKVQQKGATLQQKYIAEKVFDLLKEAWNKFNSEELF